MPTATALKKRLKQPADALMIVGAILFTAGFIMSHLVNHHKLLGWAGVLIGGYFCFIGAKWLLEHWNDTYPNNPDDAARFKKLRLSRIFYLCGGFLGGSALFWAATADRNDVEHRVTIIFVSGLIALAAGAGWKWKKRKKKKKKDEK